MDIYFQEKDFDNSIYWAEKGVDLGSIMCLHMGSLILVIDAHIIMKIAGADKADYCLEELLKAEKWITILSNLGVEQSKKACEVCNDIYVEMVWCYFLLGVKTKDVQYAKNAIDAYKKITIPKNSVTTFAYIKCLEAVGGYGGIVGYKMRLVSNYDNTIENYQLEWICEDIVRAFLFGEGVNQDYDTAIQYIGFLRRFNPDNEIVKMYDNGEI